MLQWALAHPWMMFFIACTGLLVIESAICNVCKVIIAYIQNRPFRRRKRPESFNSGEGWKL